MVAEKFQMLIGAIFFVALASVIIVIISDAQDNLDIISNLGNASGTNITTGEAFVATDRLLNGTPTLIRSTPDFSCGQFFLYLNSTGTAPSWKVTELITGSSVESGVTQVLCVKNDKFSYNATHDDLAAGTVMLLLAGNTSNASTTLHLGRGFNYTMSYTAKTFDANYNTSIVLQQQYLSGGDTQAQYFTLIILAILLAVGLGILGVNMFKGSGTGGLSGFGGGKGFSGGRVMDSFER